MTGHRVAVANTVQHRGPRTIELVDDMCDDDRVLLDRSWRARCRDCGHESDGLDRLAAEHWLDSHPCGQQVAA